VNQGTSSIGLERVSLGVPFNECGQSFNSRVNNSKSD
jgi:hypothetical protein